jgi:argininosuccinate synthase
MSKGTVVLAYSGGLDTSVCIPLLKEEYGFDRVVTVAADVGQRKEELSVAEEKGKKFADRHYTIDLVDQFVNRCLYPSIKANGLYEGYPMGTSLARPVIAEAVVKIARKEGAAVVAHGCTGKGNDQLRFDVVFRAEDLEVVAPIRERNMTREWEIEYAKSHNIPVPVNKEKPWSVDENLWSRSIEGGKLEDPSFHPPDEIYAWTVSPVSAPDKPLMITITFESGVPVALDGKRMNGLELIRTLNNIAGSHGIGRNDMMENRVLGIKAREIYEHPAATVLLAAHADLEKMILTREEYAFKQGIDAKWAQLAYYGLIYEPLWDALNAFIDTTQKRVNGDVDLRLYKGSVTVIGRSSPDSFYSIDVASFDSTLVDQTDAIGFSKYYGLQARMVWKKRHNE